MDEHLRRGSSGKGYTSNIYMRSEPGFVICLKCEATTRKFTRVCRAVDAWNRRADSEPRRNALP